MLHVDECFQHLLQSFGKDLHLDPHFRSKLGQHGTKMADGLAFLMLTSWLIADKTFAARI